MYSNQITKLKKKNMSIKWTSISNEIFEVSIFGRQLESISLIFLLCQKKFLSFQTMKNSIALNMRSLRLFKGGHPDTWFSTTFENGHGSTMQVFEFLKSNTALICPMHINKYRTNIGIQCFQYGHGTHFEMSVLRKW